MVSMIIRTSVMKKLKISQNSQENTCARVSFLIKLQVQKRSWTSSERLMFVNLRPVSTVKEFAEKKLLHYIYMFIDFKIYLAPITTYLTSLDYFCVDSVPTLEKISNLVSHFKETTKLLPKVSILLMLILHCSSNTKFFNLLNMSNVLVLTLGVFISDFS